MKFVAPHETKQSLISILDDEACVRESLSSLIRSVGYETKEYASAEDFLTWSWWEESACLILDVRLPGMGGLELQRYLAERKCECPIIFISGHATENEQTWATMRGAVAFLRKPFSDQSLLNAVRKSIARGCDGLGRRAEMPWNQVCPLCHESAPVAGVLGRFMHEWDALHASTVEVVKARNPEWGEQHGVCEQCWRFYAGLGRNVSFLGSPDVPPETNRKMNPIGGDWTKGY
jgi:CheY-like chemotaxis protein